MVSLDIALTDGAKLMLGVSAVVSLIIELWVGPGVILVLTD